MRQLGNGIQNLYGQLSILAPAGQAALILAGSSGQAASILQNGGGGAQFILGAAGIAASTEYAGNGRTIGSTSLGIGQDGSGNGFIIQRTSGTLTFNALGLVFVDNGSVWNGATGGAQGGGTINATGFFINGVAVSGGSSILHAVKTGTTGHTATSPALDADLFVTIPSAGTYSFDLVAEYTTSVSNLGIVLGLSTGNGTATISRFTLVAATNSTTSAVEEILGDSGASSTLTLPNSVTSGGFIRAKGTFTASAAGTVGLGWGPASAGTGTLGFGNLLVVKLA